METNFATLIVHSPVEAADAVRQALAAAGAGAIGAYDSCSFSVRGTGRFRPLEGANPHLGTVGELTKVDEERIEVVVERSKLKEVIAAVRKVHPYEEPSIIIHPMIDEDSL